MVDVRDAADYATALAALATIALVRPWRWVARARERERAAFLAAAQALIRDATDPIVSTVRRVELRQDLHIEDHKAGDARLERVERRLERVDDDLHDVVIRRQSQIAGAVGVDPEPGP